MERAVKASQGWHPSPICTCPQLLPWIDLLLSHCLPQIDVIDKTSIFFPPSVRSQEFVKQDIFASTSQHNSRWRKTSMCS